MTNDNKGFWQRFACLYGAVMEKGNGSLYDDIAAEISPLLNEDKAVLELACGSGQLSFKLADRAKSWLATDFSENMIAEAQKRERPENLQFQVADATALPYADNSFDTVLIANALHIMPQPDKALAEIKRVLKADGVMIAPTFIQSDNIGYKLRMGLFKLIGFKIYSKWNKAQFKNYIESQGFNIISDKVLNNTAMPVCCMMAKKL
ncbi:MAG: class I SAM-dependent methyltransferase [Oscillospiraceae bacterium]|nr:class I SAM-dependent methyltransferase [Oscillospiraceae bacterium]